MIGRVLLIHFTPPGIVGGVEQIMQRHVDLLAAQGMEVEIVAGRPSPLDLPLHVLPQLNVASAGNGAIERELAAGVVSPLFEEARGAIELALAPLVARAGAILVHNAFTLHFCLPLTAALWKFVATRSVACPVVAWTHDLAWINPLYAPSMHPGYPWDLLRVPTPGVHYVTVSRERRAELAALWGDMQEPIAVIPNGIDLPGLLRLSERTRAIVVRYHILERDLILLLPVRITRRKNIEKAIATVQALKERGLDVQLIVTGPTAPHHPERSRAYLAELKALRVELDVESEILFLADDLNRTLEDAEIAELYALSDCLFFPSESEGFGLPVLEAGALGVPVVMSRLPVFEEVGGADAAYFSPDDDPIAVSETVLRAVDTPAGRLRRRVRRDYRWESLLERLILPLLESGAADPNSALSVPA